MHHVLMVLVALLAKLDYIYIKIHVFKTVKTVFIGLEIYVHNVIFLVKLVQEQQQNVLVAIIILFKILV